MQQPVKYFYKRLKSTNIYAAGRIGKSSVPENFWIRTDNQWAGKGQGKRSWLSQPGKNLTGTLVIFPDRIHPASQFCLSKVMALAGSSFLELFTTDISVKWPNDLYSGNRKIGGILIETAVMGEWIHHAIMGIGININQLEFPDALPNPVSLSQLTGLRYDLRELEDLFLEAFRLQYARIEAGDLNRLDERYASKLLGFGEPRLFRDAHRTFGATIRGVNEFGHLELDDEYGKRLVYAYPDVEMILAT